MSSLCQVVSRVTSVSQSVCPVGVMFVSNGSSDCQVCVKGVSGVSSVCQVCQVCVKCV